MKQRLQILAVDDEPSVRRAIKLLLEHAGHDVSEADGGEAALELLAERKFDVIITDFLMPGMHGDQLVARIRRLLPAQPIIMVTAFPEEYQMFGQPTGRVDALLLKPFTLKELHDAIKHAMTPHRPDELNLATPAAALPAPQNFVPPANP